MPNFSPLYSPFTPVVTSIFVLSVFIVVLWTIVLKGYALWHAARNGQKKWFIALLIVNTLGILEIVYLIWFRSAPPVKKEEPVVHTSSPSM